MCKVTEEKEKVYTIVINAQFLSMKKLLFQVSFYVVTCILF